jgi:hypothetical protein
MRTPLSTSKYRNRDSGYVLVGVLILVMVAAVIVGASISATQTDSRTAYASKVQTREYYRAEDTMAKAVNWMRENSKGLVSVFGRNSFYASFDRTVPSVGTNQNALYSIPTKVKMQGVDTSVVLTNRSTMATAAFPSTIHSETGLAYSPDSEFQTGSFGFNGVQVTLVDARPIDPTKDFGDPDLGNAAPQTDFYPIYRVDAMKDTHSGAHVFGYLIGSLVYDYGIGFYGKNFVDFRQPCDSYLSNNGAYSSSSKRANCPVGSDGAVQIHSSEAIYGTVRTKGAIVTTSPYGGDVCADFASGCPNKGATCEGSSCTVQGLPTYSTWASYCPTNQGNLTVNANVTVSVAGNNANQKCWNQVTVNSNKTMTLNTTSYGYYIDTFNIANNGVVRFNPGTGTINLYVKKFTGDKFNGNQVINMNSSGTMNKPYQLRIHYLGTSALTLNGTADMNAFLVAPYASVTVQGSFVYSGGIKALDLTMTGSGDVHYDESGDINTLSDVQFTPRNISEYYR